MSALLVGDSGGSSQEEPREQKTKNGDKGKEWSSKKNQSRRWQRPGGKSVPLDEMESLMSHTLLTRTQETQLFEAFNLAQSCQPKLESKLQQRRQEHNDQLLQRRLELEWMPDSHSISSSLAAAAEGASWHENADVRRLNADFYVDETNDEDNEYNEYDGMEFFSAQSARHQESSSSSSSSSPLLDYDDLLLPSPEDRLEDYEGSSRMSQLVQDARTLLTHDDVLQISNGTATNSDDLLTLLQDGEDARQLLLESNMRLVWSIAKKWQRLVAGSADVPIEPLVQEGVLGLQRAISRFEVGRGNRFSTYATVWITSTVRKAVYSAMSGALHLPAHYQHFRRKYTMLRQQHIDLYNEEPQFEELAKELKMTPKLLRFILKRTLHPESLDQPLVNFMGNGKGSKAGGGSVGNQGGSLADVLPCPDSKPHEMMDQFLLRNALENAMAKELSPHERDIIRLRLGLDDGTARSLQEVADIFSGPVMGYSSSTNQEGIFLAPEDVSQTERRAYSKLRQPTSLQTHHLDDFLYIIGVDKFATLNRNYDYLNRRQPKRKRKGQGRDKKKKEEEAKLPQNREELA